MSELSYLEKLLNGGEAKWCALEDVVVFKRGKRLVKSQLETDGKFAVYQNSMTPLGYYHESNTNADTVFVVCAGAAGEIGYSANAFWSADDVYYVLHNGRLNSKYLYHFLLTQKNRILSQVRRASIPRLSKTVLDKIQVPIPCPENPEKSLAIQSEIVRILDTFTALTAELTAKLTAELTARKKQYNFYRDQLLSFDEGEVEWKTLGDIAQIGTGSNDTQDALPDGDYIFYARGREPLRLNSYEFDETAIITAGDGAGVGKVYHYTNGKYALHQRAYRIVPNEEYNPRYVYHYIVAYFYGYIQKASVSSSVTSLRRPMFLKFPIPIPSQQEQNRIVAVLDKFDTLTSSLSEGLPREIELRQKQYEYYRDLLFSFPKPDAVGH